MSTWRKWLPGALGVTVLVVIFAVLVVRLGNARQELRTAMAVEPTGIYYSQNVMDGWNDGVYHYQPGDQSLVMGNDGVYHCQNYFEDGMRHMGWYTVDGRTIRFEATDGTVRAGVYVDGALYLVEPDGTCHHLVQTSTVPGYDVRVLDLLPSPRPT